MSDTRHDQLTIQGTSLSAPRARALFTLLSKLFAVALLWVLLTGVALWHGHFLPRTRWQWLAAILLGPLAVFAYEIAGEWILDWIRRKTGLARVREAVERATVGEQVSGLRITYLLGEVLFFMMVIACVYWLWGQVTRLI